MNNRKKLLIVSHAPFWHNGNSIPERSYNIIAAALPAVLFGLIQYGAPAFGVMSLAVSSAIGWELLINYVMKQPKTVGNGNSALIGFLFGMMLPASAPWWLVIVGTFIAVILGVQIFGGIGGNPFNPVALSIAILMVSWGDLFDINEALVNFKLNFTPTADPLITLKHLGPHAIENFSLINMFIGKQVGTIGSSCCLAIITGGIYLIMRGIIRWEITLSFLLGVFITAFLFHTTNPFLYASPMFHLLSGFTMIGAFFLATEDSSSPVNLIPMLIYGTTCGMMIVLIRNIGNYSDGVVFAILIANIINPIVDKIRPKAIGKVV